MQTFFYPSFLDIFLSIFASKSFMTFSLGLPVDFFTDLGIWLVNQLYETYFLFLNSFHSFISLFMLVGVGRDFDFTLEVDFGFFLILKWISVLLLGQMRCRYKCVWRSWDRRASWSSSWRGWRCWYKC